ncbi:hypothetical protein ATANTOWER_002095 [Ataeniobius toweri]|uniref:Uncharacterized protein n=1 Tax=Ataeniobius toweri TaxID=208326 RepID=A0ABU7ALM1_9TELE|nr:hypothetical protein [Ataeniobius toweri]
MAVHLNRQAGQQSNGNIRGATEIHSSGGAEYRAILEEHLLEAGAGLRLGRMGFIILIFYKSCYKRMPRLASDLPAKVKMYRFIFWHITFKITKTIVNCGLNYTKFRFFKAQLAKFRL